MSLASIKFSELISPEGVFTDGDWVESKDQDPNGGVRLIQLADVGVGTFINKSSRFMTENKADKLNCTFLEKGDILVARMPDPIGRACIFPGLEQPAVTVVDVCVVRPCSNEIDSSWLMHLINSNGFHQQILKYVTGTTRQRISRGNMAKLEVVVPPLEEQKRIAAILDKADAIRCKRQQAIELADKFLRSVFLELFGDPVTNPKGWKKVNLEKLCEIVRGGSPRPIQEYLGGTIPWIKIGDATKGNDIYIESTKEKIIESGLKKTRFLHPGALVFANCGVSLGFARILKISGCIHDGWLAFDIKDDQELNKIYFLKALNQVTMYFRATAPDGTQPNLNTNIMKNFELILPPIEMQNMFEKIVHRANESRANYVKSYELAEKAFNSLVHQAFIGELTQSKAA